MLPEFRIYRVSDPAEQRVLPEPTPLYRSFVEAQQAAHRRPEGE